MEALVKFIDVFVKNTNFVILSLIFGLLGTVLNPRNRTLWAYLISLCCALFIGVFVGYYAEEVGFREATSYAIVVVSSVMAKDLIEFILLAAAHLNKKSGKIVDGVIQKFLDKK